MEYGAIAISLTTGDLEDLLRPTLDREGAKIKDFSVRPLTKPGENCGSTMLTVDVNLTPGGRTFLLVAKMLPKSADLREAFQCETTVRKETDLYTLVQPAYERIQKENDMPGDKYLDILPVCYGARISAKSDSWPVDETSVILLENLKARGFRCGDRFVGLDLAHCKLVIDKMARFHATAIALKIKKPDEFRKTVLRAAAILETREFDPGWAKPLEIIPEYADLKERIDAALAKSSERLKKNAHGKPQREPFATLTHLDLWTNNIMFRYDPGPLDDSPSSVRLVDFQTTLYDSPARDLLFFLYASAQLDVLDQHYERLVGLYHGSFVDCLATLGCDTAPFSFEEFLKEVEHASGQEVLHLALMLPGICVPDEHALSTDAISHEDLNKPVKIGDTFIPRARKFVLDFASRGWV